MSNVTYYGGWYTVNGVTHYAGDTNPEPGQHDAHVWAWHAAVILWLWGRT